MTAWTRISVSCLDSSVRPYLSYHNNKSLFWYCPVGRHVELVVLTTQHWNQLTNTGLLVVCCLEQLTLVPTANLTPPAHLLQVCCGYVYQDDGYWAICQIQSVPVSHPQNSRWRSTKGRALWQSSRFLEYSEIFTLHWSYCRGGKNCMEGSLLLSTHFDFLIFDFSSHLKRLN